MTTQNGSGIIVSLEGISGSGKTYFAKKLSNELQDLNIKFVHELSDRRASGLDEKIIATLSYTGDKFFRMGFPRTETFLLLALKIFDYEAAIGNALKVGGVVIEDRGIDTIAVYQAIIMGSDESKKTLDTANQIYKLAAKWRRPPDITFLIDDDFDTAINRAQRRSGELYSQNELSLLRKAATLYLEYAKSHSPRIVLLDRRTLSDVDVVQTIRNNIVAKIQ